MSRKPSSQDASDSLRGKSGAAGPSSRNKKTHRKRAAAANDNPRREIAELAQQQRADQRTGNRMRTTGLPPYEGENPQVGAPSRRHDKTYKPARTTVDATGRVFQLPESHDQSELTAEDRDALATVLERFGRAVAFELEGVAAYNDFLDMAHRTRNAAQRAAYRIKHWGAPPFTQKVVYAVFEAIKGYRPGEVWEKILAGELKEQTELRETERIRLAKGLPTDVADFAGMRPQVMTPTQILDTVRAQSGGTVPAKLTTKVIETALSQVNLGGPGGRSKGGRTPEGLVRHIADAFRKGAKMKKKSTGNSRA